MDRGRSAPPNRRDAAQKIRTTLVELLDVAKLGGLHAAVQHLENAIAETDRAVSGQRDATPQSCEDKHS